MHLKFIFFCLILHSFTPSPVHSQEQEKTSPRAVIDEMLSSIDRIKTLKYKIKQFERIEGEMIIAEQDVKLSVSPVKIYFYNYFPNKGAEVLWVEGQNDGDALVNPSSFPYFNLNLDPYGRILRKDQHHTIFDLGFDYLAKIIRDALDRAGEDFEKYCKYQGTVKWNNIDCHKIVIEYDDFNYIPYVVQQGETVLSIAKKLKVSEYMIVEINPAVDNYGDVKAGQQIMVSNAYAKKTVLYIDKRNNLPIFQKMYDEKGLYEIYEFHDLQVNPLIREEEFTKDYKEYDY